MLVLAGVGVTQFGAPILPVIETFGTKLSRRLAAHRTGRWRELVARQQDDGMAGGGVALPLRHNLDQQLARRPEGVFVGRQLFAERPIAQVSI